MTIYGIGVGDDEVLERRDDIGWMMLDWICGEISVESADGFRGESLGWCCDDRSWSLMESLGW